MTTIPDSLSSFVRFIQLKSCRARTQEEYLRWVTRIAKHFDVACPSLLCEEQVLTFVHHLQQEHDYEGSTINQCVCALRMFYRDHLGRADWSCWKHIFIKRIAPIPVVLAREEVRALLAVVHEPRFRTILALIYHCGLRLNEACKLEVTHLDRARGVLKVINGKGGKHREVPVSPIMFEALGRWWLQHKNPRFLFPGVGRAWKEKYGCAKRAQHVATQPMSDSSVQQAMSRAAAVAARQTAHRAALERSERVKEPEEATESTLRSLPRG